MPSNESQVETHYIAMNKQVQDSYRVDSSFTFKQTWNEFGSKMNMETGQVLFEGCC